MSKADKMFEELGFYGEERSRYSKRISYGEYMNIDFDLESKQYDKSIEKGWSLRYLKPTKKEYLAIHEKMKELGWLDE